jgi:cephalosporin-C deacetylase
MPMLDMPLEQLRTYTGRNPRPADHDEYWARALAALDAQEPQVEFVKAEFQVPGAECYDLYFTGVGGSRIHCRFVRPEKIDKPAPALLQFHGYGGNCGSWSEKLSWVAMGYVVCAMDTRGQNGESEDRGSVHGNTLSGQIMRGMNDPDPDNLYYRNVYLDTALVARIVMGLDYVDAARVSATGGSQGGALTIACAALTPTLYKAVPMVPFLCDYKRVWEMDLAVNAYADIKEYFRHFDPTHAREEAVFTKLGYIDLVHLAPRIQAKLQMHTGLMDNICPPSTQFAMYNHLTCEKSVVIYPDYAHETPRDAGDIAMQFIVSD